MCKQCTGVLNPLANVDYNTKQWLCPLCHARNHFPPHYQGVTSEFLPAELFPDHSTIEYTLPKTALGPPVYIFIVDVSLIEDELETCKTALVQVRSFLSNCAYSSEKLCSSVQQLAFESSSSSSSLSLGSRPAKRRSCRCALF